jgi:chromosome partitioning protein
LETAHNTKDTMIITVLSTKGGVGKTTSAIHIAYHLSSNAQTMLWDTDPNPTATFWSKRMPFQLTQDIPESFPTHLVIDTQPHVDTESQKQLEQDSDLLVLPTFPSQGNLAGLYRLIDTLEPGTNYKVLLNKCLGRAPGWESEARKLLEGDGIPVFKDFISDHIAIDHAMDQGFPLAKINDRGAKKANRQFKAVVNEILS